MENWILLESFIGATDDHVAVYDTDKKRVNSVTIAIGDRFLIDRSRSYF